MSRDRVIHVRQGAQTLGAAIKSDQSAMSWADVKAAVRGRRVHVNGNLCLDDARRLKAGDVVKLFEHPQAKVPTVDDLRIVHLDEHLVVIDKPAGMTTLRHAQERDWPARRKQLQPTVEEALQRKLGASAPGRRGTAAPRNARAARPAVRVRPVHRLDRDTSGLMVFALSPRAEQLLVDAFKHHRIERAYRAIVYGHPGARTIETTLVRDRGDGLRGSSATARPGELVGHEPAQHAVTHVRPIERIGDYSVVECRLETGRTHQIRIHLSELGHRLCGEKVYTHAPGQKPARDTSGAPRQALHAATLGFVHPIAGGPLRFESPWPDELRHWLTRLRAATDSVRE